MGKADWHERMPDEVKMWKMTVQERIANTLLVSSLTCSIWMQTIMVRQQMLYLVSVSSRSTKSRWSLSLWMFVRLFFSCSGRVHVKLSCEQPLEPRGCSPWWCVGALLVSRKLRRSSSSCSNSWLQLVLFLPELETDLQILQISPGFVTSSASLLTTVKCTLRDQLC